MRQDLEEERTAGVGRGVACWHALRIGVALRRPNFAVRMNVLLQAAPPDPGRISMTSARPAADGSFRVGGLTPGRFTVQLSPIVGPLHLKSTTLGGTDVTDLPIEIGAADVNDLVVTYGEPAQGTLTGAVVLSPRESADNIRVLTFPADRRYWQDPVAARRLFNIWTAPKGTFTSPLRAGDYFVTAVPVAASIDWLEPSRLEELSRSAQRVIITERGQTALAAQSIPVTLAAGERKTQDLAIK